MQIKVLIMCGGKGTRLGNLTKNTPKPLMKINGKTIIEYKLNNYSQLGLNDYVFCIGFQGHKITEYLKNIDCNAEISDSGENAGILKRVFNARKMMGNTSIIGYGDTFAEINFSELINRHVSSRFDLTLVIAPITNPFGIVNWDSDNCVVSFEEKPVLNHFIGYMVLEKKIFDYIPADIINMPDGEGIVNLIQYLSPLKKVGVYNFDGLQFTVNTKTELDNATDLIGQYYTI